MKPYIVMTATAGIVLGVWSFRSMGVAGFVEQLAAVGSLLPLLLGFAVIRFALQAAGWRLAMPAGEKPSFAEAMYAVIAGEGAGYFAFGPVSREPVKAALVNHRVDERAALAAAISERFTYTMAATVLSGAGLAVLAYRTGGRGWLVTAAIAGSAVVVAMMARRASKNGSTAALAAAQEAINLFEAYLVLAWLGAAPTLATIVALEGGSRLLNAAGQFVPGKLGVSEAASTMLAGGLQLGSAHGLTLALARRARSILWSAAGISLLTYRTAPFDFARGKKRRALGCL